MGMGGAEFIVGLAAAALKLIVSFACSKGMEGWK